MTTVHYTNSLSAHQLPLDYELVKLVGADNFRYVYTNETLQGGAQEVSCDEPWIVRESKSKVAIERSEIAERSVGLREEREPSTLRLGLPTSTQQWLESADALLVGGIRPIDLMERRLAAGKATFYMAERWFKPLLKYLKLPFFDFAFELRLPGWLRLLHPRYFRMARRFVKLFDSPNYRFLPIGPWSARDMRLLYRVMHPFTSHFPLLTSHFIKWGDFVAPSECPNVKKDNNSTLRLGLHTSTLPTPRLQTSTTPTKVLWVGRMLDWKRVDTLVSVAKACSQMKLTLVGGGPMANALKNSAANLTNVVFKDPVSLPEVRRLMRENDVYVLPSNAYEGWGAVVPEAMSEGMTVLGTYEAGASAALLPESNLFHCGDWRTLAKMLIDHSYKPTPLPYDYTPKGAAERLLSECEVVAKCAKSKSKK